MNKIHKMRFLLLIFFGCIAAAPARAQESQTVKWNDPSRPGLLKVNWHNGNIIIKTHSSNDVTISGSGVNRRTPPEAGGLRRIDGGGGEVMIDSDNNNVITLTESHLFGGGNVEIEVPAKTNLNLQSHNGSIISVDGVEGNIEATNHNGSVNLTNVSGSVVAYSHNGKVIVVFRDAAPDKPMSFSSMNGNVDLTLPASAKANLRMRTDNGSIWSDFDIQRKTNASGSKTVDGSINGGGADFDLRTHNGNIFLRKAK